MIRVAWMIVVCLGFAAMSQLARAQTGLVVNGVACEQVEAVAGMTACFARATLDGAPFRYNFSVAGAAIDLNQDGIQDLILSPLWFTAYPTPTAVNFFRGTGNGKDFLSYVAQITGDGNEASALFTRNIIVGDFNNDGKQDFYLADGTEYATPPSQFFDGTSQYLYLNSGSGTFVKRNVGVGIKTVHGSAAGVPSKDGFALVLNTPWQQPVEQTPNWVNFISASATGSITNKSVLYNDPLFAPTLFPNGPFPYLTAIDVNGDGVRDVVMLGRGVAPGSIEGNKNHIWMNDGMGNFTQSRTFPNWSSDFYQAENAEVADLNGDGLQDMIVMHIDRRTEPQTQNSTLRVWINDGKGGFVDQTAAWLGSNFQDYTGGYFDYKITDLDGDGFPDVVFTTQLPRGSGSAKIVVLRNNGGKKFDVLNFDMLKWNNALQAQYQWMPGSVVIVPVNGKPTVLFSRGDQVYSLRFAMASEVPFVSQSDCLINWAERTYPSLFAPGSGSSSTYAPYYYRYYSQTNAYLGASFTNGHVYYLGAPTNNAISDLGPVSGWLATAGCH